jgi:HNH endonuclease
VRQRQGPRVARPDLRTGQWQRQRRAFARTLPSVCELCGQVVQPFHKWHLDHRVPVADGGSSHVSNLRAVHATCNLRLTAEARHLARKRRARVAALSATRWDPPKATASKPPAPAEVEESRIF